MTAPRRRRRAASGQTRGFEDLNRRRRTPTEPSGYIFESEVWFVASCWLDDIVLSDLDQNVSQWNHDGPQPEQAEATLLEWFGDLDAAKRAWATLEPEVTDHLPNVKKWLEPES
jgi:hypothetical protein